MPQAFEYKEIAQLYELFSAPLIATIDADFYAAKKFIDYLVGCAFEAPGNPDGKGFPSDWGRLKTITFSYETRSASGVPIRNTIRIPLIAMIPLPILQLDRASFDMEVRILGAYKEESIPPDTWAFTPSPPVPREDFRGLGEVMASLSPLNRGSESISPSLSANLKVHLELRVSDLPAGISRLLNVVQDATQGLADPLVNHLTAEVMPGAAPGERTCQVRVSGPEGLPVSGAPIQAFVLEGGEGCRVEPPESNSNESGLAEFRVIFPDPARIRSARVTFSAPQAARVDCLVSPPLPDGARLP